MSRFDAIIIGSGQAGGSLAGRLTAAGMSVAFVERKLFGGTCVNTGCMPTKTLVASAYAAHLARRASDYGIVLDGEVRIDMPKVRARAAAVSTNAREGVEKWLRSMKGCTVIQGHARFESADTVRVGDTVLTAPRIFINVGGRAERKNIDLVRQLCRLVNDRFAADPSLAARFPDCPAAHGRSCDSLMQSVTDRPGHDRRYAIDPTRIATELGFEPTHTLESGLAATVDWYLANESWWRAVMDGSYRGWMERQYGQVARHP